MELKSLDRHQKAKLKELNIQDKAHLAALLRNEDTRRSVVETLSMNDSGLESLCRELDSEGLSTRIEKESPLPEMGSFE